MENEIKPEDAEAALDLVSASRSDVADRLITPWWYHPVLGVLAAGPIATLAARSMIAFYVALALCMVGCALLMMIYRRMTGLWISGHSAGQASAWAFALSGAVVVAAGIGGAFAIGLGWWPVPLALGVLLIPVTVVLGRRFDTALRAGLRDRG
jgi:hypothetical protein